MALAINYQFVVYKGRNEMMRIDDRFLRYNDVLIPIGTGDELTLTVVRTSDGQVVITKPIIGSTDFEIVPEDTRDLAASVNDDDYKYNVHLKTASVPSVDKELIAISDFVIKDTFDHEEVIVSA